MAMVREHLLSSGLLLLTDPRLPSVAGLVAGEPVRGSWWSHPAAQDIYAVSTALDHDPDVVTVKLVRGKITFVHRLLWGSLFAVVEAGEPWQTRGLGRGARALLKEIERSGELRPSTTRGRGAKPPPGDVKQVEARLLVYVFQEHTDRGSHARVLESWPHLRKRLGVARSRMRPATGRAKIEAALITLSQRNDSIRLLPWSLGLSPRTE